MKVLPLQNDTLQLDSSTLAPGSVILMDAATNQRISDSLFTVDEVHGTLIMTTKPQVDSLKVVYRTMAIDLNRPLYHKEPSLLQTTQEYIVNPFSYTPSSQTTTGLIDFGNLEYNGSFARGLSFGNNQNVVLNSNFNLQIAGYITQDIEIVAALTDNNIPIQPDGTTQQLQEFDKVYIQINKEPHHLIVGDYEIGAPAGHFMKFYKNLQGASYDGYFQIKDSLRFSNTTSVALAKGRFSRNQLNVTEGNQGPYKLTGANGETFIIVLAGTERVFVNGKQLVRGAENDYIIDYNLGEITFTPNVIMTEDLRVFVEFEYSEQNYFRSFVHTNNVLENNWARLRLGFYNEQDNKNQSIQADLTQEQKLFLSNAGETITETQFPGYRMVDYDPDRVLYQLVDTTVNSTTYDTVFVYSTDEENAVYALTFAYLGPNKGNYRPASTTANGRVFEWVAPENGTPQGSYEPIITLVTPKRRQMTVLGLDLTPGKNDMISTEVALTNDDLNTFSEIGNNNNIGFAGKGSYAKKIPIGSQKDSSQTPWQVNTLLNYEFVNHNFNPLDRYRPVEFERNWNYTQESPRVDQHLASANIGFQRLQWGQLNYEFSTLQSVGSFKGYNHTVNGQFNHSGYALSFRTSVLQTESNTKTTLFIRPLVIAEKAFDKLKGWRIGGRYEHDNNKQYDLATDTLLPESFVFTDWRVYVASSADSAKDKVKLEYIRRLEWRPLYNDDALHLYTASNTWNLTGSWVSNKYQNLSWKATYRRFENRDSTRINTDLEEYYLGRVQYGLNVFKGAINTTILYELGAGQEQRREYTYVAVNSGEGNFIWIDYNENGIKELNEFELATFTEDTMYIRVLNPTNEFDPVNITVFNQILNLSPEYALRGKKGILGFIARFRSITSVQVNRRAFRGSDISPFNPFLLNVNDDQLVATNSTIRQSLYFNRSSTAFSLEYTFQDNRNKTNYNNGFETRRLQEHLIRPRILIFKGMNLITKVTIGSRSNDSQFFTERNYDLRYYQAEPELSYLFKSKFRISGLYSYTASDNVLPGSNMESARINKFAIRSKYSLLSKGSFQVEVTYARISYTGATNSPVEFAMLQGLKPGANYLWNAGFSRTVGKNIQLNLTYEGRKTGTADMVHIGRAQIRAIF